MVTIKDHLALECKHAFKKNQCKPIYSFAATYLSPGGSLVYTLGEQNLRLSKAGK